MVVAGIGIEAEGAGKKAEIRHPENGGRIGKIAQSEQIFPEIVEIEQFARIEVIAQKIAPVPEGERSVLPPLRKHGSQSFKVAGIDRTHVEAQDEGLIIDDIGNEDDGTKKRDEREENEQIPPCFLIPEDRFEYFVFHDYFFASLFCSSLKI